MTEQEIDRAALKRLGNQIALQLPETREDGLYALAFARVIYDLHAPAAEQAENVLRLVASVPV